MVEKRADEEEHDGFRMCTIELFEADIPGTVHGLFVVVRLVDVSRPFQEVTEIGV